MRSRFARWCVAGLFALSAGVLTTCGPEVTRGQLMVRVTSEMPVPQNITRISMEVRFRGTRFFQDSVEVGAKANNPLPITLAVVRPTNPAEPVVIRVGAWDDANSLRVVRQVTTTVPKDRVALLDIPLEWLCLDKVQKVTREDFEGEKQELRTDCPSGTDGEQLTCVSGKCVSDRVNSDDLPDYVRNEAQGANSSKCFNVIDCFAQQSSEVFTLKDGSDKCAINSPEGIGMGNGANVALVLPAKSPGFCTDTRCLIPLNGFSEQGWTSQGKYLRLPEEICRLVDSTKIGVAVTVACKTKPVGIPSCEL